MQRPEVEQPLFAEEADVQVDAIQRAERADRIRPVLQDAWRPGRGRRREELRERMVRREEVVELPVVELAAGDRLLAEPLRQTHARPEVVDRVHRPRVVDVVARHERGVERAGQRGVERLVEEAAFVGASLPVEHAVPPEVLRADVRAEVRPRRVLRIGRRLDRVRARRGRTRTTCRRGTAAPGLCDGNSSDRGSSAPRPSACAPSSKSGLGNRRRPTTPVGSP